MLRGVATLRERARYLRARQHEQPLGAHYDVLYQDTLSLFERGQDLLHQWDTEAPESSISPSTPLGT